MILNRIKISTAIFITLTTPLLARPLTVEVGSKYVALINAENGKVLYEKRGNEKCYPASTTKVATALYVLNNKDDKLNEFVQADGESLKQVSPSFRLVRDNCPSYRLSWDGTSFRLMTGELISAKDLIYGLMLSSGNDAANVLSKWVCGDIEKFMLGLNSYIKSLGIVNTRFTNPHGLFDEDHYTTALDLAQIARFAMQHKTFREVVSSTHYVRPKTNKQLPYDIYQPNKLLRKGAFYYPHAIGIKTGYVSKAGHNLVAAAQNEERSLIVVLIGASHKFQRYKDAIALFEAAFNEVKETRTLFTSQFDQFTMSVKKGKGDLKAALKEDLTLTYFPSEEEKVKSLLEWYPVNLPIKKGDVVGEVRILNEKGETIKSQHILATTDVDKKWFYRIYDGLIDFSEKYRASILAVFLLTLISSIGLIFLKKNRSS